MKLIEHGPSLKQHWDSGDANIIHVEFSGQLKQDRLVIV